MSDESKRDGSCPSALEITGDAGAEAIKEHARHDRIPDATRCRSGHPGKPRGRPKRACSRRKIVERVLLEKHRRDANGNGRRGRVTTLEIVILRLRQNALEGNTQAFKAYKALEARVGHQEPAKHAGYLESLRSTR